MSIRQKLLLFTPLLVALPLLAWFTLQATEAQFRAVEGASLSARAATAAATLPEGLVSSLDRQYGVPLPAPALTGGWRVDGYFEEWGAIPAVAHSTKSEALSRGGPEFAVSLWAASVDQRLALRLALQGSGQATRLQLIASGSRGLLRFAFPPLTEGPVRAFSAGGQQIAGVVREADQLRMLEFSVPLSLVSDGMRLQIDDGGQPPLQSRRIDFPDSDTFYVVARPDEQLQQWLSQVTPDQGIGRLVLGQRVLLTAGQLATEATALERFLYRWVFEALPRLPDRNGSRAGDMTITGKADSVSELNWYGAASGTPVMEVVEPLSEDLELQLQAPASATLQAINTVWLQLMLGSLLVFGLVVLGLLFFSSRLVSRIRQLSRAATEAASDPRAEISMPQSGARDEIGELARAHDQLLGSVGDYARYLDSLAGRLSHELRTPLAITRSSLDNLEAAGQEDATPFLERARQGLDRQADLIAALTEASRLDQALTQGEMERVDLNSLLAQYLEAFRATRTGFQIETDLPASSLWVEAQPDRLVQLLDKLFDNAVSFAPVAGHIACRLESQDQSAVLTLHNEGPGLPEGDSRRLFDSLVSHRSGGGRHLGLGLYVARQIVLHHSGQIELVNRNKGVAAIVTLPLLEN